MTVIALMVLNDTQNGGTVIIEKFDNFVTTFFIKLLVWSVSVAGQPGYNLCAGEGGGREEEDLGN